MEDNAGRYHVVAENCSEAYLETLAYVLANGMSIPSRTSSSVRSGQDYLETFNFALMIRNPADRLTVARGRHSNLTTAVARFVWLMSGSNELSAIAFYEPGVAAFSDNGLTVPGSSFGHRIFRHSGVNQLAGVIARLKEDPGSRRAAISIYEAEDAVRESRDIPCLFGVFFHIRQKQLVTTVVMRSNNALSLLPYNLFELTLLAEVTAAELCTPLGPLSHLALSMHVLAPEHAQAMSIIAGGASELTQLRSISPPLPNTPSPLAQIETLVRLEAKLRREAANLDAAGVVTWMEQAERELHPYWRDLFFVLLHFVAERNGLLEAPAICRALSPAMHAALTGIS